MKNEVGHTIIYRKKKKLIILQLVIIFLNEPKVTNWLLEEFMKKRQKGNF